MTDRERYPPRPASGAQVRKEGEKWTLIVVRELRPPPEKVWHAPADMFKRFAGVRSLYG